MTFAPHIPKDGKFPYLQQMDIIIRIEQALAGEGNMIVFCLKNAIKSKKPAALIIKETKEMIKDNYDAMAFILGDKLCEKIKSFM